MPSNSTHHPISALHEILKWAIARPDWQQDALRRIVINGTITEADLKDLDRLCRAKHEADASPAPALKVEPLAEVHLPPGPGYESLVTLVSIGNLQHVNRIPSDQVLPFGSSPGLTVIYGDNGSGKSGYARVIKKACRTRGTQPIIQPNAFLPSVTRPATAQIVYQLAGTAHPPVTWTDGMPSDANMANIFVFDASTADHYLSEDAPATFTPWGLDVLPKLSKVCDEVKRRIQHDIDLIKTEIENTVKNWKYNTTTHVGTEVGKLSAATKTTDIEALAVLTEKQALRLRELNEALKADAKQKAKETRATATRLRDFAAKVTTTTEDLSATNNETLCKLIEDAETTAAVAKLFTSGQFDSTYLQGTGGDVWRKLWEAAQLYSTTVAYPGQDFPVVTDNSKCVLCQREIDKTGSGKLMVFDAFCKDQSQQLARETANRLTHLTEKIEKTESLAPKAKEIEADLVTATAEQKAGIDDFVKSADSRLAKIKDILKKAKWTVPPELTASPVKILAGLAQELDVRSTMEESADDPTARAKLKNEQDELTAKEWLCGVKTDVLAQIERFKHIATLETCQRDTATAQITAKSTELTKLLVTEAFRDRFKQEVGGLELRTLDVKLEEIKGMKGETKFGLRLASATSRKVAEIASEGEQRCIALSAFLAELSQASHKSALVFDDPVCSLDHRYQERIAARLAYESLTRQVIVFTHDCIFLNDLQDSAKRENASVKVMHLEWNSQSPGYRVDGLPWDWKSPRDRFDKLEKEEREITQNWNSIPNDENKQAMRIVYSWLRATLERMVEKEIFADVVFRFRNYVNVNNLGKVVGFSQTECSELQRLVQRCHNITEAHDPPPGRHPIIPSPTELAIDIADAKALLLNIQSRCKANQPLSTGKRIAKN